MQQEMYSRHKRNHPPAAFDPAWLIEPTIANNTDDGVDLWKWSNARQQWELDAQLIWSNS
jgi:hypothetical protein